MREVRAQARHPRRRARQGLSTVGLTSAVVAAAVLSVLLTPPEPPTDAIDVAALREAGQPWRSDSGSDRPEYRTEPDQPLSVASAPAPLQSPVLVSKTLALPEGAVPYLIPDSALPYRYHVDRRLVERFGLAAIVDGIAQWDGIPGSRWATELISVVDHPRPGHRADGASTVYLRDSCPQGYLGSALWSHDPKRALIDERYGTGALYGTQVDIAICPGVTTGERLRGVLAHEVGHVAGMAHLCEPGEVCWQAEAHEVHETHEHLGQHACRPMYHLFGPCRGEVGETEHDAMRHLYPALPRLWGPSAAETAARASYATTWTHTARDVVLVAAAAPEALTLAGAALAAAHDAPLLVADPAADGCLDGAAAEELARAAERRAAVHLLGAWPESCDDVLAGWALEPRRVLEPSGAPADASAVAALAADAVVAALATQGRTPETVTLVPLDEGRIPPVDGAAAVAAIGSGIPMLLTDGAWLATPTAEWLVRTVSVDRAYLAGPLDSTTAGVRAHLRALGVDAVRLAGTTPLERSLVLQGRGNRLPPSERGVVLARADQPHDLAVAAVVAARLGALHLPLDEGPDEAALGVLNRLSPAGGFLVGAPTAVPYPSQWAYTAAVRPAAEPVPSAATRRPWWTTLPLLDR